MGGFPGKGTLALGAALVLVCLSGCGKAVPPSRPGKSAGRPGLAVSVPLTGVHIFGQNHGWLLDRGLYITADGGRHWTKEDPPLAAGDDARDEFVTVAGPRSAWVAVASSRSGRDWVKLFGTTDGGRSWTTRTMEERLPGRPQGQDPAFLTFAGREHGWLVTGVPDRGMGGIDPGALYHTADGGRTWRFLAPAGGSVVRFYWLVFRDAATGSTVGGKQAQADPGVIVPGTERLYRTVDGGRTWRPVPVALPAARYFDIHPPVFVSARDGILPVLIRGRDVGLVFYATGDGGTTWRRQGRLTVRNPGTGPSCDFLNTKDGLVFWSNKLYVTHDGARTFTTVNTAFKRDLEAQIDFTDARHGWLVRWEPGVPESTALLYETSDGGHTWVRRQV